MVRTKVWKVLLHGVYTGEFYYNELPGMEAVRLLNKSYGSKAYRLKIGYVEV